MAGQSRSHFLRQVMVRPQVTQVLGGCSAFPFCDFGRRSGIEERAQRGEMRLRGDFAGTFRMAGRTLPA